MRFVENITTTLQKTAVPQVGRLIVQLVGMVLVFGFGIWYLIFGFGIWFWYLVSGI